MSTDEKDDIIAELRAQVAVLEAQVRLLETKNTRLTTAEARAVTRAETAELLLAEAQQKQTSGDSSTSTTTNTTTAVTTSAKEEEPRAPASTFARKTPPLYEGRRHVTIHNEKLPDDKAALLDPNSIQQLRLIRVSELTNATLEILSSRLANCLKDLELWEMSSLNDEGLAALTALTKLTRLFVYNCGNNVTRDGIVYFFKRRGPGLINLDFRVSVVDSDVVQDIVEFCPSLKHLSLSSSFADTGLEAIGELKNLETIRLSCCRASDAVFGQTVSRLTKLRHFDLEFGEFSDRSVPFLPLSLTKLTLTFISEFTDTGLEWVLNNLHLTELSLDRSGVKGTKEAVEAFLNCPTLQYVTLSPWVTDDHLAVLVHTNIAQYNLFSNKGITNKGAKLLESQPQVTMRIFTDCSLTEPESV